MDDIERAFVQKLLKDNETLAAQMKVFTRDLVLLYRIGNAMQQLAERDGISWAPQPFGADEGAITTDQMASEVKRLEGLLGKTEAPSLQVVGSPVDAA